MWVVGLSRIKHDYFAYQIHRDEQSVSVPRHAHQLRPSAYGDTAEIKDDPRGSALRIHEVERVVRHAGAVSPTPRIARDQFHINGSGRGRDSERPGWMEQLDGSDELALIEVPHPHAAPQIQSAGHGVQGG